MTSELDTDGDGIPDIQETFDWVIVCLNDATFMDNAKKPLEPQDGFPEAEIPPTNP